MDTRGVGHSASVGCDVRAGGPYGSNVATYAADDAAVLGRARIVKEVAERASPTTPTAGCGI
jgi:hypothetical protein